MPTYEYRCSDCGYEYEVFHKMSQDPLKTCPQCSKDTLKRLIGGKNANLHFKGSGFYITDYVKDKSSPAQKTEDKNG